ncbi:restriction endonuclease subunit S [Vibrio parahaemolyticus]|uniref:restriction endonuclease subunit S n=1 Tax=Vibrio sp. B183 TaxID=1526762 RepID=UPI0005063888|nr:restriction endonuclease subunit S [Vibrio sp. B183]EHR0227799.1 restriction endonuclease subunit S [Vibrio parahaemolyticus]KFI12677.1 restriction modification system DNA specificity subunit [Vibrio sp. B183]
MTGRYKAYSEYKESGVKFAPKIPSHWTVSKVNYISTFGRGLSITKANLEDEGIPCVSYGEVHSKYGFEVDPNKHSLKCVNPAYLETSAFALLSKGDFVFADTSEDIEGSGNFTQLVSDETLFAGYHTVVVRPDISNYYRFIAYLFDSSEFRTQIRDAVKGVKVFSVTQAILKNANVWLPEYEEQQRIANFLDHETAKIDTLIMKQERLIELLKEKRQAVISHAVTKGLNPDAPMKDSGVEWLGEVPEHWVVTSIKRELKSLDSRRIPLSADERGKRTGEYRYYGASGVIDFIDDYIFDESTVLVGEDGANLLNRNTPLAFSAHGQYWVNNHAHILSPLDGLADYWAEVIEIIDVTPIVSGSAQPKLTAEALNNLKIAFPTSFEERQAIEKFICIQKSKYDQLMEKAKNQVGLLKERKTALISAAVTGKIDVR